MIKTFSLTDIGKKRTMNQDYIFTSETPIGSLPNLFIVADGMGGYNGGDYASSLACEVVKKSIVSSKAKNPRDIFSEAISLANETVLNKASETEVLSGMGTTIVIATIIGDILHVANVGDSRLYIAGDSIRQITIDHSYVEEMIKVGSLSRDLARNHPQKNIITRAIGAEKNISPDFFTVRLNPGELILMCSDGLSNMIEDDEMLLILKKKRDLAGKVEELIKVANENGGKDNEAVIVIDPFAQ